MGSAAVEPAVLQGESRPGEILTRQIRGTLVYCKHTSFLILGCHIEGPLCTTYIHVIHIYAYISLLLQHCRLLAPHFEEAAAAFAGFSAIARVNLADGAENSNTESSSEGASLEVKFAADVTFASVDCVKAKRTCATHNIYSYPTILLLDQRMRQVAEYPSGPRQASDVVAFVLSKLWPSHGHLTLSLPPSFPADASSGDVAVETANEHGGSSLSTDMLQKARSLLPAIRGLCDSRGDQGKDQHSSTPLLRGVCDASRTKNFLLLSSCSERSASPSALQATQSFPRLSSKLARHFLKVQIDQVQCRKEEENGQTAVGLISDRNEPDHWAMVEAEADINVSSKSATEQTSLPNRKALAAAGFSPEQMSLIRSPVENRRLFWRDLFRLRASGSNTVVLLKKRVAPLTDTHIQKMDSQKMDSQKMDSEDGRNGWEQLIESARNMARANPDVHVVVVDKNEEDLQQLPYLLGLQQDGDAGVEGEKTAKVEEENNDGAMIILLEKGRKQATHFHLIPISDLFRPDGPGTNKLQETVQAIMDGKVTTHLHKVPSREPSLAKQLRQEFASLFSALRRAIADFGPLQYSVAAAAFGSTLVLLFWPSSAAVAEMAARAPYQRTDDRKSSRSTHSPRPSSQSQTGSQASQLAPEIDATTKESGSATKEETKNTLRHRTPQSDMHHS